MSGAAGGAERGLDELHFRNAESWHELGGVGCERCFPTMLGAASRSAHRD
jgi:hypothetical protein